MVDETPRPFQVFLWLWRFREKKKGGFVIVYASELADAVEMIALISSSHAMLRGFVLGLMLSGTGMMAGAQVGTETRPDSGHETTTQRPTSTPYSGDLSIFEYPDRDKKLQIDRVMDLLGVVPGKNVADIGAGSGWFTVRASRRVGLTGTVIAEDINPLAIEYIGKRALKENLTNIRTVLGAPDDPRLPSGSVDAVLMLKVYHEIAHPVPTMKVLQQALRPGAKVGIIDRNGNGADHGLNHEVVVKEMGEAGYKLVGTYDFTKADGQDYFLIFQAR